MGIAWSLFRGQTAGLALLTALALASPRDPDISHERLLSAAKVTEYWREGDGLSFVSLTLLGSYTSADLGQIHITFLRQILACANGPHGLNFVLFHSRSGVVFSGARCWTPPTWDGHRLLIYDGTSIDLRRPGFLRWLGGREIRDHFYFGMTQKEMDDYK